MHLYLLEMRLFISGFYVSIDTLNGPISTLTASMNALVKFKLDKDDNFAPPTIFAGDVYSLAT